MAIVPDVDKYVHNGCGDVQQKVCLPAGRVAAPRGDGGGVPVTGTGNGRSPCVVSQLGVCLSSVPCSRL